MAVNSLTAPKVFVSHAREDKHRFVTRFATRLRDNGVDAWLDQWEIKAGDSLVQKIFEIGLKEASAVIIVLSNTSVEKPWVREELNTSVVNRISRGTKLIPVIIDDCEIPECLRSICWHRVTDLQNYDDSLQAILSAIFEIDEKPPIGKPPRRFSGSEQKISGLNRVDGLVLVTIASRQLDGNSPAVSIEDIRSDPTLADVPRQELLDAMETLDEQGLIQTRTLIGATTSQLTDVGFQTYCKTFYENYQKILRDIAALLINEEVRQNDQIAERLGQPIAFVDFVLNNWQNSRLVKTQDYCGGHIHVTQVSTSLKRILSQ